MLKWAITPNPDRRLDVKVKDSQSKGDPAKYFMSFLDVSPGYEREQFVMPEHSLSDDAVTEVTDIVSQLPNVDATALSQSIARSKVLTDSQKSDLPQKLNCRAGFSRPQLFRRQNWDTDFLTQL